MRIDSPFDPIFGGAQRRADGSSGCGPSAGDPGKGSAGAERKAFVFDGWSYQPMADADPPAGTRAPMRRSLPI